MGGASHQKIKSGFVRTTDRHQAGVACVASVINYYGGSVELQQLHKNSGAAENGVSLLGLCKAARIEGFAANGFKANIDAIKGVNSPVILHVSKDFGSEDFIVVYGWFEDRFIVGDPQWGIIEYRQDELEAIWKSSSLIFMEPEEAFQAASEKKRLKLKWLLQIFNKYKKVILTTGLFSLISAFLLAFAFYVFSYKLIIVSDKREFLIASVLILSIFSIFILVLHFKNVFVLQGTKNLRTDLIARITKNVFNEGLEKNDSPDTSIKLYEKTVTIFSTYCFHALETLPFYTILFFVSLTFISLISVWAGIVVFLGLACSLLISWMIQKKIGPLTDSENESFTERIKILNFNARIIRNIKLANGEKDFILKNTDNLKSLLETKLSIALFKGQNRNWLFLLFTLLALMLFGFVFDFGEDRSQIHWLAFFGWLTVSFFAVYSLSTLLVEFKSAQTSYNLIYNRIGGELIEDKNLKGKDERRDLPVIKNLSVDSLEFAFPGQVPLFQNVKFEAKLGDITFVNGATGSGKSTLVSLLARVIPLQSGVIKINGINWNMISDFNWKANISAIIQPIQLYNGSVIENIGIGDKMMEPKKIISFCKKTGFDKFIKYFPNGYATSSDNLSAGQQQLVALAMALYKKPKLLLLDVPFVCMDEEMTSLAMELIRKLKNQMLIIIFNNSNKVKSKADKFFVYKMGNYIS